MGFKNENPHQSNHYIPSDLLDDLCSRFIINLPPEDRWDLVRVCFHVELAHWFYLDNYCMMYQLRPCGQKTFATHIFKHIPDLRKHVSNLDIVLEKWREYKRSIPTYGAILLDEDLSHVLLVQPYCSKSSWGFPKGKVNEDEKPWNCAAREVLEETGFDISKLIKKREYIDATVNRHTIRLYIVANVPRDTNFKPRTRNEIKSCEWFPIDYLPSNKKDMTPKVQMSVSHKKFVMVIPFIKKIRRWVSERNPNKETKSTRGSRHQSMSYIELSTDKADVGISQELQDFVTNYREQIFSTQVLQDAVRKFQQKNFPTQEPQNSTQYPHDNLPTLELQIAYTKYLQCNQPTVKLLNMGTKNQQQSLPYYKYQDGKLYQVQSSPMTPNNSYVWSTNTSEKYLSNLEKYYQQDLPTQQLKNALMIYEKQDFPYFEYQESQLYQEQYSPNESHSWSINTSEDNLSRNESKLSTGKRLLTSSDWRSPNAVRKEHSCDEYYDKLYNFVAPSWADFKFDKKAILDSMT